jgi:hypothetical protein
MVSRFEPAPGLDAVVASRIARPNVERLNEDVRDVARRLAPDVRTWLTVRDERVRRTHEKTDGQTIPDNLRFKLPSTSGVGHDLAKHPRDPNLPIAQRINCRCDDPTLRGVLAATIHALPAVLQGTRTVAQTETRFPRAAESENGTSGDQGAFFMRDALREVAARLNARGHR